MKIVTIEYRRTPKDEIETEWKRSAELTLTKAYNENKRKIKLSFSPIEKMQYPRTFTWKRNDFIFRCISIQEISGKPTLMEKIGKEWKKVDKEDAEKVRWFYSELYRLHVVNDPLKKAISDKVFLP